MNVRFKKIGSAAKPNKRRNSFQPTLERLEARAVLAAGDFDLGLNGTGYVITGPSSTGSGLATDVSLQPADHKIVTVGTSKDSKSGKTTTYVLRHFEDGRRDSGFGSNGAVNIVIGTSNYLRDVALQADGKILLAGYSESGGSWPSSDMAMVRLNTNGTLDKTFGKSGVVTADFGSWQEQIEEIAIQPDGKIVVAGFSRVSDIQIVLARYNPNGSLDSSFGVNGKVYTDLRAGHDSAKAISLQSDGKIVVAGSSNGEFVVARYTATGALDTNGATGFGAFNGAIGTRSGYVITSSNGNGDARDVLWLADGRILAAGVTNGDYAVARYNSDGSPDLSMNGTGVTNVDFSDGNSSEEEIATSAVVQPDGTILVAGDPSPVGFGIARLTADGLLDTSFGNSGRLVATAGGLRHATKMALQPWDGKLVVVGAAGLSKSTFAIARFVTANSSIASVDVSSTAIVAQEASTTPSRRNAAPSLHFQIPSPVNLSTNEVSNSYDGEQSNARTMKEHKELFSDLDWVLPAT